MFQFHVHQHWIRLAWPAIKLGIFTALIVAAGWFSLAADGQDPFMRRLTLAFFTVLLLLSHFEFLCRVYRYFLYIVVVSDRRVHRIKKTLLVTDDHESIDLWMLQDIHKQQCGILQTLFGYGSVVLEAQETVSRLHFIPCIKENYHRILHLREQARGPVTGGFNWNVGQKAVGGGVREEVGVGA